MPPLKENDFGQPMLTSTAATSLHLAEKKNNSVTYFESEERETYPVLSTLWQDIIIEEWNNVAGHINKLFRRSLTLSELI